MDVRHGVSEFHSPRPALTRRSIGHRFTLAMSTDAGLQSEPLSQHSEMSLITRRVCLSVTRFYLSRSITHHR